MHGLEGVGRDLQIERVGQVGDLHPLRDSADPAHVRLRYIQGSAGYELPEPVLARVELAPGDGDARSMPDLGHAGGVVGQHGLFQPSDLELLELTGHVDCLLGVVAVVGVDVEGHVVPQ